MAKSKITLYVDIVSPFGYMGYYATRHHPAFKSVDITYVPIFLGGLMKQCNNTAPISIVNKGTWIGLERTRWAKIFEIPMCDDVPKGFPVMTISTMRALCYLQLKYPDQVPACLDALYESAWAEGDGSVGKPEGFGPILEKVLGKETAGEVVKGASSAEAKKKLNENTEDAFKKGAFGLPWFDCENDKGEKKGSGDLIILVRSSGSLASSVGIAKL